MCIMVSIREAKTDIPDKSDSALTYWSIAFWRWPFGDSQEARKSLFAAGRIARQGRKRKVCP